MKYLFILSLLFFAQKEQAQTIVPMVNPNHQHVKNDSVTGWIYKNKIKRQRLAASKKSAIKPKKKVTVKKPK